MTFSSADRLAVAPGGCLAGRRHGRDGGSSPCSCPTCDQLIEKDLGRRANCRSMPNRGTDGLDTPASGPGSGNRPVHRKVVGRDGVVDRQSEALGRPVVEVLLQPV